MTSTGTRSRKSSDIAKKPTTHRAVQHRTRKDVWQIPCVLNVKANSADEAITFAAQLDADLEQGNIEGIPAKTAALNPASQDVSPAKVKALSDQLQQSQQAQGSSSSESADDSVMGALASMFGGDDNDPFGDDVDDDSISS